MSKRKYGDYIENFDGTLIEQAPSGGSKILSRQDLMNLYNSKEVKNPIVGNLYPSTFVGISQGYFNFDSGFKDFIRVENKNSESSYLKNIKVGDVVDVLVTNINEKNFLIEGSFQELYENRARINITSLEEGTDLIGYVKESTPAGYSMDIEYDGIILPGFMPNTLAGINRLHNPESIVGTKMEVMVESYSSEEGTYIVNRRKYLQKLIPKTIKELEYNRVYNGHVTGTTDFGIFVEFNNCLTGMVHKSNINPEYIDKFNLITPGLPIEFYIKEILKDKIILTQVLKESLWDSIKVGQKISGVVKDIKSFGALISLDGETNGLIHTSELNKTPHKISIGQEVDVKIIAMDRMSRKIFLQIQ
jgi:ribosomal protein S1